MARAAIPPHLKRTEHPINTTTFPFHVLLQGKDIKAQLQICRKTISTPMLASTTVQLGLIRNLMSRPLHVESLRADVQRHHKYQKAVLF